MNLEDAETMANSLLRKHGLSDWEFVFDHAKRRFGSCNYGKKRISLSKHLCKINSAEEVKDTILHEIAHALTPKAGHGPEWKAACLRIGAKPERLYDAKDVKGIKANYIIYCPNCGYEHERFRRSKRKYYCAQCCKKYNNGRVDSRFLLRWRIAN